MLFRTHLAIVVFAIILFVQQINNKFLFIFVTLIATLLPDVDSPVSTLGKNKGFRFLQFFVKHRSFIHSFTFCIIISLILAVFFPVISFAFFLGYAIHLFVDSFTKEGIQPFWPYKVKSSWKLKTGSLVESSIFLIFLILDIILVFFMFF